MGKQNEKGKPSTGKPGPSVGFMGFMHTFLWSDTIQKTLWLNLFSEDQIQSLPIYTKGVGTAPWEKMPEGESCPVAQELTQSLMGRLIPLSRFCLLAETGLHYSEGISHPDYKKGGVVDPSMAVICSNKDPKVLWVDPEKRPWRQLTSLLSFFESSQQKGFDCYQIRQGINRNHGLSQLGIWSGGLRVSSNAGEQYASGSDDYVESIFTLEANWFGEFWYQNLKKEMAELDQLSKWIYGKTLGYFQKQKMEGKAFAALASNLFWQLCERRFQELINACPEGKELKNNRIKLRQTFAGYAHQAYDFYCPKETARQLDAWAQYRPNLFSYTSAS